MTRLIIPRISGRSGKVSVCWSRLNPRARIVFFWSSIRPIELLIHLTLTVFSMSNLSTLYCCFTPLVDDLFRSLQLIDGLEGGFDQIIRVV